MYARISVHMGLIFISIIVIILASTVKTSLPTDDALHLYRDCLLFLCGCSPLSYDLRSFLGSVGCLLSSSLVLVPKCGFGLHEVGII